MEKLRYAWTLVFSLLIIIAVFNVQMVKGAEQAIVIKADGSIDPPDAPINKIGDYYVLTSNLINASIRVERSNIIIDGSGCTVQGAGTGKQYSIGIHLVSDTNNVTIRNFVVKGFFDGIQIYESSSNTVMNCTITENGNSGIRFGARGDAPPEAQPSNNMIVSNIITYNGHDGIQLYKSTNNHIAQNFIAYNRNYGIDLAQSSNNIFRNNTLTGNKYNFAVLYSPEPSHFINDIDISNTVDGKPIYYFINQKNLVIDSSTYPNVGYLALVNSTNITVKGLTLENSGQGILLAYTNNSQIINNTITNSECGIKLCHSLSNTITGNLIKNVHYGSWLEYSTNNIIRNNNFTDIPTAIYLEYSTNNIISGNNFTNVTTQIYDATPTNTTPTNGGQTQPPALPPWMIAAAIVFIATATLTLLLKPKTKPRRKTSRTRYKA